MQSLLFIAIVPVILLCTYVYMKDLDKEPKNLLKKVFIRGMISIIPVLLIELILGGILSTDEKSNLLILFVSTLVTIALIEETAKWIIVYKTVYNDKEFNHPYDAIVYSVFSSLGFALIENIFYVFGGNFVTGVGRALLSVPSHACDAVIMGYFLGKAKQEEHNGNQHLSNKYMTLSLILSILTHTVYDYLIFTDKNLLIIIFLIYVIATYIISYKVIKKISKKDYNFDGSHIKDELLNKENNNNKNQVNSQLSYYRAIEVTLLMVAVIVILTVILT